MRLHPQEWAGSVFFWAEFSCDEPTLMLFRVLTSTSAVCDSQSPQQVLDYSLGPATLQSGEQDEPFFF